MSRYILRVENNDGGGPYCRVVHTSDEMHAMLDRHSCCKEHPTPFQHGEPWWWEPSNYRMVCGFENKQQLDQWFTPEEIHTLQDNGFGVAVYQVEEQYIGFGRRQIVFLKTIPRTGWVLPPKENNDHSKK